MKKSHLVISVILAFAGCVSIDEQLASSDPATRAKGRQRIVEMVLNGTADRRECLAAIAKLDDKESVLTILAEYDSYDRNRTLSWERELQKPDFYKACIDKLDQQGLYDYLISGFPRVGCKIKEEEAVPYEKEKARYALSRMKDASLISKLYAVVYAEFEGLHRAVWKPDDVLKRAKIGRGGALRKARGRFLGRLDRFDILAHVASQKQWKDIQSPDLACGLLLCACDGGEHWKFKFNSTGFESRREIRKALAADRFSDQDRQELAKKVTAEEVVRDMLNYSIHSSNGPKVYDPAVVVTLGMNVNEEVRCEISAKMIEDQFNTNWQQDNLYPFLNAARLAATCSDSTKSKLCLTMLSKLGRVKGGSYYVESDQARKGDLNMMVQDFKDSVLKPHWSAADEERINRVMDAWVPLFTSEDIRAAFVSNTDGCEFLLPYVKDGEMLLDLYKNVDRVKLRTHFATQIGVKDITADLCRKEDNPKIREILLLRGGSEVRTAFEGRQKQDLKPFLQRAEAASKTTFSFQGFYLGMDVNDAFALIRESVADGEAKVREMSDGTKAVVVIGQSTPFCRADKAGKVFRFDFGRQWLDKWFQSKSVDAATLAAEYGQHFGVKLESQTLTRKIDAHEKELSKEMGFGAQSPQGRGWYHELVIISQDAYDGVCDAKKYKLTYYGKKETQKEGYSPRIGASSQGLAGAMEQGVNGIASSLWTKLVSMKIASETENVMSDEGVLRVEMIP